MISSHIFLSIPVLLILNLLQEPYLIFFLLHLLSLRLLSLFVYVLLGHQVALSSLLLFLSPQPLHVYHLPVHLILGNLSQVHVVVVLDVNG